MNICHRGQMSLSPFYNPRTEYDGKVLFSQMSVRSHPGGRGIPQGTYPQPGQDGGWGTPRYLSPLVRSGWVGYPKVPTPPPQPGQDGGTPRYLTPSPGQVRFLPRPRTCYGVPLMFTQEDVLVVSRTTDQNLRSVLVTFNYQAFEF